MRSKKRELLSEQVLQGWLLLFVCKMPVLKWKYSKKNPAPGAR